MFGKKAIINSAFLDLRSYSSDALKKIKLINAATIVLPSDADKEFYDAFAEIKVNSASRIKAGKDENICTFNGSSIIDGNTVNPNTIYVINGSAIIHSIPQEISLKIFVNGMAVIDKNSDVEVISSNGTVFKTDFDINNSKYYNNNLQIDKQFISYCEKGCTIIAGNTLTFTPDVTTKDLEEKGLHFIVGNSIKCNNLIYGYVAANSHYGNKII